VVDHVNEMSVVSDRTVSTWMRDMKTCLQYINSYYCICLECKHDTRNTRGSPNAGIGSDFRSGLKCSISKQTSSETPLFWKRNYEAPET